MKYFSMVNDLEVGGKVHPKGASLDVDDGVGKGLVVRGLAREERVKAAPENRAAPAADKPEKGDKK